MNSCPACGFENADSAKFCSECGTPLAVATPSRREERKVVTVVFADLVGSTARAERLDPEDVRAILTPYHERLRHELERFGGTVEKFIGDAVVGVFGAPVAHEDDAERAVRAALSIQDAIAELNEADPRLELEVRIGVNTGEALVALGARPELGEAMVAGDVMNTGARLQSAAPPGAVLVSEPTQRLTARAIEYGDAEPVAARGKAEPLPAWIAIAPRARFGVDVFQKGRGPLVARERELDLLADALSRARAEQEPQLVTLVGVPGIGKSRLVYELWRIVDEPRNDVHVFMSQMQLAFIRAHNLLVDRLREDGVGDAELFDEARRALTWHYQWLILGEFLPALVGTELIDELAATGARFYHPDGRPFIPLEFADAAYRYGHSQIRQLYQLQPDGPLYPVFPDLIGFRPVGDHQVDWSRCSTSRPDLVRSAPSRSTVCCNAR